MKSETGSSVSMSLDTSITHSHETNFVLFGNMALLLLKIVLGNI